MWSPLCRCQCLRGGGSFAHGHLLPEVGLHHVDGHLPPPQDARAETQRGHASSEEGSGVCGGQTKHWQGSDRGRGGGHQPRGPTRRTTLVHAAYIPGPGVGEGIGNGLVGRVVQGEVPLQGKRKQAGTSGPPPHQRVGQHGTRGSPGTEGPALHCMRAALRVRLHQQYIFPTVPGFSFP